MACTSRHQPWTTDEVELLLKYRRKGRSYAWIARQMDRAPGGLRLMMSRQPAKVKADVAMARSHFFHMRRWELQQKRRHEKAQKLRAEHKAGLDARPWTPYELRLLPRLRAAGLSWASVGRLMGRSERSVTSQAYWRSDHEKNKARARQAYGEGRQKDTTFAMLHLNMQMQTKLASEGLLNYEDRTVAAG